MKIKVKDLRPNPFRRMERYPLDPYRIEALKASINQTDFWDNLLARQVDGIFQLAYGHHRLIALQELNLEEIDIPVRNLDDATMIQIMANENATMDKMSPAVVNETVAVAKEFLDGELEKYETWEECPNKIIKALFTGTKGDFLHAKREGVGQTTLAKFLGAPWKQWQIQQALLIIEDEKKGVIDREATEAFQTMSEAGEFQKIAKEKGIPKEKQADIAQTVATERGKRKTKKSPKARTGATTQQRRREFQEDVKNVAPEYFQDFDSKFETVKAKINTVQERIDSLWRALTDLDVSMQECDIEQIGGLAKFFIFDKTTRMLERLGFILDKFGIKLNKEKIQ